MAAHETVVQTIILDEIAASATNPRTDFSTVDELAESIRRSGVLQPIIVRLFPGTRKALRPNGHGFELVAGERRLRAAKVAGLDLIPAIVRELDDVQALEVQAIENLQREDLHPIEEAEGYEQLLRAGLSVEDIVERLGQTKRPRSRAYVYGRLKFRELGAEGRKAFREGKLAASTALLVARIPGAANQKAAVKAITHDDEFRGTMSYREAARHVREEFMRSLRDAPFSPKAVDLVPEVGSCAKCPKRTGNAKDLFSEVKATDVCTDPGCYGKKVEANVALKMAAGEKRGLLVLKKKAAERVFYHGSDQLQPNGKFASLTDTVYHPRTGSVTSARRILGTDAPEPVAIAQTSTGKVVELVDRKALEAAVAKATKTKAAPSSRVDAAEKARQAKAKREREFRTALLEAVLAKQPAKAPKADLVAIAEGFLVVMWDESRKRLTDRRGWKNEPARHRTKGSPYRDELSKLTEAELFGFLLEAALVSDLQVSTWSPDDDKPEALLEVAKRRKVDASKIRRTLAAAAAKKTKKTAPAKARKAKATGPLARKARAARK